MMYAAIEAKQTQPFVWGMYDCSLFVADVVFAFTGVDVALELRGAYSSRDEAEGLIKKHTKTKKLSRLMRQLAQAHGMEEIRPAMAGRGDVMLFPSDLGETLGLCDGHQIIAMGYEGVKAFPRTLATRAWRI
jgi:hypothetical protein